MFGLDTNKCRYHCILLNLYKALQNRYVHVRRRRIRTCTTAELDRWMKIKWRKMNVTTNLAREGQEAEEVTKDSGRRRRQQQQRRWRRRPDCRGDWLVQSAYQRVPSVGKILSKNSGLQWFLLLPWSSFLVKKNSKESRSTTIFFWHLCDCTTLHHHLLVVPPKLPPIPTKKHQQK